jgi:hypothetical protein
MGSPAARRRERLLIVVAAIVLLPISLAMVDWQLLEMVTALPLSVAYLLRLVLG